jgi:murein DD-endopeptidase MepM/ murein hydrolase activator NlpD
MSTPLDRARARLAARTKRLAALKKRLAGREAAVAQTKQTIKRLTHQRKLVAPPFAKVLEDSWGWHPGVHDGLDLIVEPHAVLHSMCDGRVVRADPGGWWGLGAPKDPVLKAKGDGIIIVRCTVTAGPFAPGLNICYGHAENAKVQAGQAVKAGDVLGEAGFANAWHTHLMVNDNADTRGVGDRDPRPFYEFARKNG